MARVQSVGQFEQIVLTSVLGLGKNAHGVTIHGRVEELAVPRSVSLGAVNVTLDRLEAKGLVESWLSDPTPERGDRCGWWRACCHRAAASLYSVTCTSGIGPRCVSELCTLNSAL